jgi:carbonic anhydrase
MQKSYQRLLDGNKKFVAEKLKEDPNSFKEMSKGQTPEFLWIGCSDSRVPANQITGTEAGEIFVHRNIANMVVHTDLNMLSVLQYAVQVLKVKHVIVCGHYGCGGVRAAVGNANLGLVNKWIRNIKEIYYKYESELNDIADLDKRADRLAELNVKEQVFNLAKTSIVQDAWKERKLQIHGWIYGLQTGKIIDLNCMVRELEDLPAIFRLD